VQGSAEAAHFFTLIPPSCRNGPALSDGLDEPGRDFMLTSSIAERHDLRFVVFKYVTANSATEECDGRLILPPLLRIGME